VGAGADQIIRNGAPGTLKNHLRFQEVSGCNKGVLSGSFCTIVSPHSTDEGTRPQSSQVARK